MKLSVEFDLVTKSEANIKTFSVAGMHARRTRVKKQREDVRAVLKRHFGALVPPTHVAAGAEWRRNKVGATLTRIAPALLDDDNLRPALKAVRDEVAAWIGVDDRDPLIAWGYEQHKAATHVYRVRIELNDARPGEGRNIVEPETASAGRAAASRVRGEVRKATRQKGHEPAGVARKARSSTPSHGRQDGRSVADPGDERPAREMAACETCGRGVNVACKRIGQERFVFGVHEARARAAGLQAPADDRARVKPSRVDRAGMTAAMVRQGQEIEQRRRLATVPGQARLVARRAFAALPWENGCAACEGDGHVGTDPTNFGPIPCDVCKKTGQVVRRLAPLPALDGIDVPREAIEMRVPGPHVQRWGLKVKLCRRKREIAGVGVVWLYVYETT